MQFSLFLITGQTKNYTQVKNQGFQGQQENVAVCDGK